MVKGLKKLPYETRLKRLGIYTPERRRLCGDLIETFKILTGKERIDYKNFFELADATSWLRRHSLKLYKPRCHTRLRQNFFSVRVINEWNKLPQSVIEAPSVNAFKNRLDKYWSESVRYGWELDFSLPRPFAPGSESSRCGTFAPWNFCSLELSLTWLHKVTQPTNLKYK